MKQTKFFTSLVAMLFMLMPVSMMAAWSYVSNGNVLSAYGEGGYTAQNPLSITISAPADLQFNGNYKPATISNTDAWTAAGLTVPTILYNGKTNAPSMLGTYTATISAGGATAEVVYTIKTIIDYQSFFNGGLTQGRNFDIVPNVGTQEVALNNSENRGVYWNSEENCAVFDGEAYLQIDNPLGNVTAETGFTLTMDVWISSENNGNGYFYRSTGAYVKKSGWQRLFDLSDGHEEDCIFINAGNANSGTAHLMWCLRKGYGSGEAYKSNTTGRSYYNQWSTITMVVAPGGYTTLYVNGELLTHSVSSDISKIVTVLNSIHEFDKCYIGTSIFEAGGGNADGFFFGKIRGFQTAEGALMPYYDGSGYHYLLSYETNGGNPITGTFEATIPTTLPTPTHPVAGADFQGWFLDEALTIPVTTGVTLTQNTSLYAKWNYMVGMAEGTEDVARWSVYPTSAPEGATITVNYIGNRNVESIEIGNTHTYYVNTTSDLSTAVANFNANPGSRLVLNTNVSTMTITADEGVIDLNGHAITSTLYMQNNTLDKVITIKNGRVNAMDGNGGWSDVYMGTVIMENVYMPSNLYTDGHAFILKSGTYAAVQNFTKDPAPGTVKIYRGVRVVGRNTVSASGGTHAGTFIDLSELAPASFVVTEVVQDAQWTFTMPAYNVDVIVNYTDFEGHGTEDDPYLIPSTDAWNKLVYNVNDAAHNYAEKYFRQTANISVSTMLGYRVSDNGFRTFNGIYDGDGYTLDVAINGSETFTAPFHCIANATIKNLVVTGSVTVSAATNLHPSGLVGVMVGTCALENCLVSANVSGSRYMGGLIGHSRQANYTITGCVYNGTLTTSGNYYAGGLTGWGGASSNSATITDCLFAGTYVGSAKFHPVGCFDGNTRAISNMYYTQAPSGGMTDGETHSFVRTTSYKGERVYSVTAGTGVTITPVGTPVTSYNVSKLDLYETDGFSFDGVRYGGQGDVVSLTLSATEHAGYGLVYSADHGTLNTNSTPNTLTMAAANTTINVRYSASMSINAPTTATNGWYFIASPIGAVNPVDVEYMTNNEYDIFRFNQNPAQNDEGNYLEWENWNEANSGSINHNHFDLEPGRGYLYANSADVTLNFVGTPYSGNGQVSLSYSTANPDTRMRGWNLIGNPFGVTATITKDCYKMKNSHDEVILCEGTVTVNPMEGVLVYTETDGEIVTFTPSGAKEGERNENNIVINLTGTKGNVIDRAIVSFDKDHTLPKFQIRDNSTKIYIPQNGVDYAMVLSYRIGELPLNFKAQETGRYTLSFSGENMTGVSLVDMIDNAVIDLSVNDTYTFIGSSTDRENRFKLVFSSQNDSNIEIFAYQSDNDIVVSGEGELQVFDVMGRMVMNQRINGVETVRKPSQTGVYIFRLKEKVQKIVVR